MNIDGFPDRLKIILKGESVNSFAEKSGVNESLLRKYLEGSKPRIDKAQMLADAGKVSVGWLINGEEPQFSSAPAIYHAEGFVYIPRYEVRAGAGTGQMVGAELISDFLAFREDWIRYRLRRNPADLVVIEAVGDSMSPTIDSGDVILIDRSETRIRDSSIYVLLAGDELVVKRVERRIDGSLLVRSDNSTMYAPQEVKPDQVPDLRVIGRVVWAGGVV